LTHQEMIENRDRIRCTVNEHRLMRIKEQEASVKEEHSNVEREAQGDLDQIQAHMLECETEHKLKHKAKPSDESS